MVEPTQAQQLLEYMGMQDGSQQPAYQMNQASEDSKIQFEREMALQDVPAPEQPLFPNEYGEGVTQRLFNGISDFDQQYRATMEKLQNYPSYKGYLEEAGLDPLSMDKKAESSHISNISGPEVTAPASGDNNVAEMLDKSVKTFEDQIARQSGYYTASLDYQQQATQWFLSTQFWASKVRVLTSAVSQITNNVRTLFTSQ